MFGVEGFSFLPDLQRDGGDLSRPGQARHLPPPAFGQQSQIKFAPHSFAYAGRGGRALEQILHLVVVVPVQPANQRRLAPPFHSSVHHAVLATVPRLQPQSAIAPELALGAEAGGVCTRPISSAARIGPKNGTDCNHRAAACLRHSAINSRRTSWRSGCSASSSRYKCSARRRNPPPNCARYSSRCRFPYSFLPTQLTAWLRNTAFNRAITRVVSSVCWL